MEIQNQENLHNQEDVNPGAALKKTVIENENENMTKMDGTGGNRPVQTEGTVVIKDTDSEA